jgi:hypothetical protein
METEGSLLCSHEPSIGPYPEPDAFSPEIRKMEEVSGLLHAPAALPPEKEPPLLTHFVRLAKLWTWLAKIYSDIIFPHTARA